MAGQGQINVTVASGFSVSSCFTLDRPTASLGIFIPSLTASDVRVEFCTAGSGTGFAPLTRGDGTGLIYSAYSGSGPGVGWLPIAPTMWARISCVQSQADVRTFGIVTV